MIGLHYFSEHAAEEDVRMFELRLSKAHGDEEERFVNRVMRCNAQLLRVVAGTYDCRGRDRIDNEHDELFDSVSMA